MEITTALMEEPVRMTPASVLRDLEEITACTVSGIDNCMLCFAVVLYLS